MVLTTRYQPPTRSSICLCEGPYHVVVVTEKLKPPESERVALLPRQEVMMDERDQMSLAAFVLSKKIELRTAINSMMVLAPYLKENADGNLTKTQVEMLGVICTCGYEIEAILNEILRR